MQQSEAESTATLDLIQQELAVLIRRALRGAVLHTEGQEHQLDLPAFALLARLADEGPQRSGDLARAFAVDKSTMSRQVSALQRAGLVERVDDPVDGRAFQVRLSERGRRSLAEVRAERRRIYRELLGHWPELDRRDFARLLARFNAEMAEVKQRLARRPADSTTAPSAG
jgi:DNA-binding MarR family transcriptional regulator